MMGENEKRHYQQGHPHLAERNMFAFEDESNPEALFIKIDDPRSEVQRIQHLVRQGYIVRTRADADTEEARNGNYNRLKSAIESGAQMISTDFYLPSPQAGTTGWSHYQAILPEEKSVISNTVLKPNRSESIAP